MIKPMPNKQPIAWSRLVAESAAIILSILLPALALPAFGASAKKVRKKIDGYWMKNWSYLNIFEERLRSLTDG